MKINWTVERVAELTRLFMAGYSAGRIAMEIGIPSRNAVIGKVNRLKLSREKRVSTERLRAEPGAPIAKPEPTVKWSSAQKRRRLRSEQVAKPAPEAAPVVVQRTKAPKIEKPAPEPEPIKAFVAPLVKRKRRGGKPVTIMDLTNTTCRWSLWDHSRTMARLYCGKPDADLTEDRPYCAEHSTLSGAPLSRKVNKWGKSGTSSSRRQSSNTSTAE